MFEMTSVQVTVAHCALHCAARGGDLLICGPGRRGEPRDTCPRGRTLLGTRVIRSFQRESQVKSCDK